MMLNNVYFPVGWDAESPKTLFVFSRAEYVSWWGFGSLNTHRILEFVVLDDFLKHYSSF